MIASSINQDVDSVKATGGSGCGSKKILLAKCISGKAGRMDSMKQEYKRL